MRRILEENLDELLTRRQVGDFERLRDRTQAVIAEIEGLVARGEGGARPEPFGKDAVQQAEERRWGGPARPSRPGTSSR